MDILSYVLAKKYTEKIAASGIVSVSVDETSEGTFIVVVYKLQDQSTTTIRYAIPTITGRGISNVEITEDYKLKITYSDGTVWTSPQSIRGPKGDKGDKGDPGTGTVSVSATGTSTNDVRYITIDGTESRFASVALREMKTAWKTGTTAAAATAILNDDSVIAGDGFLATVYWTDLPGDVQQAEVKAFVLKKEGYQKIVQFECTSGTVSPYAWFYNSYEGEWRAYTPVVDVLNSSSTTDALSANQGRVLNTALGSKADLEGGKVPLSQLPSFITEDVVEYPTRQDFPATGQTGTIYVAKDTGKSYRWVGSDYVEISNQMAYYSATPTATTMGELRTYINNINTSGLHCFFDLHNAITDGYVCTVHMYTVNNTNYCQILDLLSHQIFFDPDGYADATTISAYCSDAGNKWASPRDVQINGTSIINNEIANITDAALADVKYTTQSLTDAQKTQARTNISACAMQEYDSTAASYAENVLYYTTE